MREKLKEIIESNLADENFGMKELSQKVGISRMRLNRLLISSEGKTLSQFVRETRLNKAYEILQNEDVTAAEVAYRTGFRSPAYFNTCFHKFFGFPPGKVKVISGNTQVSYLVQSEVAQKPNRKSLRKKIFLSSLAAVAIIALLFLIFYSTSIIDIKKVVPDEKITVVVLPFQNMTADSSWNVWQDGIQDNLITTLSGYEDLKVRQTESVSSLLKINRITSYSSLTSSRALNFSRKLSSDIVITGGINKNSDLIRINAQVINTKTGVVLNGYKIDGNAADIFHVIDSLSVLILNTLKIKELVKMKPPDWRKLAYSESPEAYQYYIFGNNAMSYGDYQAAIKFHSLALEQDTNFIGAEIKIAIAYHNSLMFDQAKKTCLKVYERRYRCPLKQEILINWLYCALFRTPYEQVKYLKQLQSIDDQVTSVHSLLGQVYFLIDEYETAIPEFQKVIALYKKWGVKPDLPGDYSHLAYAFYQLGHYRKAEKYLDKEVINFPENDDLDMRAWLAWHKKDSLAMNQWIEKVIIQYRQHSFSEPMIYDFLGLSFSLGKIPEMAEKYLRKAYLLANENEKPFYAKDLAYLLIDNDININEGIELIDKALEDVGINKIGLDKISEDTTYLKTNYFIPSFLHPKGWGLYKEKKYEESLKYLQKADDEKPIYNHELYLHLEAAKRAVAELGNN